MNCADAREAFSAYLDEALEAGERSAIEAHLVGCGECRRELERFRQTVALLHRVERPRAPVGFVDRVLQAAAPVPWYSRMLRGLFMPLRLKLPLEAAAIVLLSIGAVYLYERTAEVEQAAREMPPQVASRDEGTTAPPAGAPAQQPPASTAESARARAAPKRQLEQEKDRLARDGKLASVPRVLPSEAPAAAPPASKPAPSVSLEAKKEAAADNLAAPRTAEPQSKDGTAQSASGMLEGRRDGDKGRSAPAPAAPPSPVLKSAVSPATVNGRLTVKDRPAAEQALGELLTSVKATEISRRREVAVTTVEVLVPREAYAEFTQGLTKIGGWTVESEPAELPAQVRITLRLSE